ncbi:MAG: ABC transporter ATP-binding protein [Pelovirga sp.]
MIATQSDPVIRVAGLTKTYPGSRHPAVDRLNLEVTGGLIFGLLGPNGAGKTTTISIVCTLLRPDTGRVEVLGQEVLSKAGMIRRSIGLVPQEIALYPTLTIRENLCYFARVLGVEKKRLSARVGACLDLTGLADLADRRVDRCSGGMKRRANLAVGILHEPQILLLDEPTVGIDAQSRNLILEQLRELNRQGMTLLYTTHYMREAEDLCDEIAVIDSGRVVVQGAPRQLIGANPACENLEDLFLALTGKALRE